MYCKQTRKRNNGTRDPNALSLYKAVLI